jgi:hypothetical protein
MPTGIATLGSTTDSSATLMAVTGSQLSSHGTGSHDSATVTGTSTKTFAEGISMVLGGAVATCGHIVNGGTHVFAT